jgi:hypothetical protein
MSDTVNPTVKESWMFRRLVLAAAVAVGVLALPATAGAVSTPVQIGTYTQESGEIELPSVAVDSNGTAYAAWPDLGTNLVDYCVLPDGATSCQFSGTLSPVNEPGGDYNPANFPPTLSGFGRTVDLAITGNTVSIIATVIGSSIANDDGVYTPTEEWLAPDGTANFTLVNGGNPVAYPNPAWPATAQGYPNRFDPSYMTDEVTVPGTGYLGELDFSPGGPPSFQAFPDSSAPPTCSEKTQPPCAFATLEPMSNPDPVSNYSELLERQVASATTGPNPGILAEFETVDTTGPFACTGSNGGADQSDVYMYGNGLEGPSNDYNISPGQPNSAWKVAATPIPNDCPGHAFSVAGGPSGLGLLQASIGGGSTMKYLPLDPATGAFDEPAVTVDPNATASTPDLAQDGAGNLYATGFVYQSSGGGAAGAPLALYYSGDGGKTWQGPGALETNVQPGFDRQQTAVGADGKGWMVITTSAPANGQQGNVYALEFSAADATNALAANVPTATSPTVSDGTVTVGVSCFTVPCTVDASLLQGGATASRDGHVTGSSLGSGAVTITQHGVQTIHIPLSSAGQSALQSGDGHLPTIFSASTAIGPYSQHTSTPLTISTTATTAYGPAISGLRVSKKTLSYRDAVAGATRFVVYIRKHRRWVEVGTFVHYDKAGANLARIKPRLAKGNYRIKATPYLAGKVGRTVTISFTVR